MNLRLLLVLLTAAAQGQTIFTCGTKQADPKNCMAAKLCVTSSSTHKTYCGATMAAAEAQEMAHEPEWKPLEPDNPFASAEFRFKTDPAIAVRVDPIPAITPVITLKHVDVPIDIRYCDQVPAKDAGADCVRHGSDNLTAQALQFCAEDNMRLEDEVAGYQDILKAFASAQPHDDCDYGKHWVEKEHDKWGSRWVCEEAKP